MADSYDNVSNIHRRYSLTLINPSSFYTSLIFSIIAATVLITTTVAPASSTMPAKSTAHRDGSRSIRSRLHSLFHDSVIFRRQRKSVQFENSLYLMARRIKASMPGPRHGQWHVRLSARGIMALFPIVTINVKRSQVGGLRTFLWPTLPVPVYEYTAQKLYHLRHFHRSLDKR